MSKLIQFAQNEQASMTLEFVAVLPLMLFWFVGSIVFFDAYKARMDADAAAIVIADITSRHVYVNDDFLDEMVFLHRLLLPKVDTTWLRISTIVYDADQNSHSVRWSHVPNALEGEPLEDDDIPTDLLWNMYDGEIAIIVDTQVPYEPMVDWVRIGARNWESRKIIVPRPEPFLDWCVLAVIDDCDATTTS